MSEPIKVGDLVVVIKPRSCGCNDTVGTIFRVSKIRTSIASTCYQCLAVLDHGAPVAECADRTGITPLWRLKRIDPLPENETENHDEEITA